MSKFICMKSCQLELMKISLDVRRYIFLRNAWNLICDGGFYQSERIKIISFELFSFFFQCVAANISELFYTTFNFSFKYQILYAWNLASLSWWKSTQCEKVHFFKKCVKLTRDKLFAVFNSKQFLRVFTEKKYI